MGKGSSGKSGDVYIVGLGLGNPSEFPIGDALPEYEYRLAKKKLHMVKLSK